jgi:hypothetical protein
MPEECSTSNKQFFLVTPKTKTKQKLHKKDFHSSLHYYHASGAIWKETLPRSSGGKTRKKTKEALEREMDDDDQWNKLPN